MFIHQCPECGKQYSTQEKVNRVKCPYCGAETNVSYAEQEPQQSQWQQYGNEASRAIDSVFNDGPSGKSRGIAGLLALLMGAFGLHYFYIGKTTAGVVFLIISLLSCFLLSPVVHILAVIQGVLFFTSTQEEFEQKWVTTTNSFPLF